MASTSRTAGTKQLMKVLAAPSKIANALDWRRTTGGTIATLDVHADRIGVRISHHPKTKTTHKGILSSDSNHNHNYSLLVSVSRKGGFRRIPESTRQQLSDLVHQHKVCGFVVSWPIQEDTGLMGAACGRTLFAIEELLNNNNNNKNDDDEQQQTTSTSTSTTLKRGGTIRPVFAPSRPICLWDATSSRRQQNSNSATNESPSSFQASSLSSFGTYNGDVFGRSPLYARTSDKTEHFASKEQYHQDESIEASGIWDDFVRTHWPELEVENEKVFDQTTSSSTSSSEKLLGLPQQRVSVSRGPKFETEKGAKNTAWVGGGASSRSQQLQTAIVVAT